MTRSALALLAGLLLSAGGGPVATAAAETRVVASVDRVTPVSAYGSGILWSRRDPATGRFRLWYTDAASPAAALPIAERGVPFDADLGPGPHGHFLAVYSRCRVDPPLVSNGPAGGTNYALGRGCDLYEYDLTSHRERRITAASSPRASEYLPSVWKDGVAFARVYDDKRASPYLYTHSRTGSESSRRQPGGQRNACAGSGAQRRCSDPTRSGPTATDLYGRRLAFGWTYQGSRDGSASDLRLDDTRTDTHRRVDAFAGGGLTTISLDWPAFESGRLYYARACFGDRSGCPGRDGLIRYRYSTADTAVAPIARSVLWTTRAEGHAVQLIDRAGGRTCTDPEAKDSAPPTCEIVVTTPAYAPAS